MFKNNISKDEINDLELGKYRGEIIIISEAKDLPSAMNDIMKYDVVGFDTETKPVFVKGQYNDVALIQIGIPDKVYLIRLNLTGVSAEIITFFESKIKKIGVGLRDDIIALQKMKQFNPNGFIELNELVNQIDIEANGLRKLVAIILGFRISKNSQVSNWEATNLDEKQKRYAATDAWVCIEMYNKLKSLSLI